MSGGLSTIYNSIRVGLHHATKDSDLVECFRILLHDTHSRHTPDGNHQLTLDIELDPVESDGDVVPMKEPDGPQGSDVFARFFESANFDTLAQRTLLCSLERNVMDKLGDAVNRDHASIYRLKAVISGRVNSRGNLRLDVTSLESRSKSDWETLWRSLMAYKLTASQDIACIMDRAFASIDIRDGCVYHLEPCLISSHRDDGMELKMDLYVGNRSAASAAVTVRCRHPMECRLSYLDKVRERIGVMLRDRTVSEDWSEQVKTQLEGVVDEDEDPESGSDAGFDPEDDESHDLAHVGDSRISVRLGFTESEM